MDGEFEQGVPVRKKRHALRNVNVRVVPEVYDSQGQVRFRKTTLINLLGGLDTPTSGKVFLKIWR